MLLGASLALVAVWICSRIVARANRRALRDALARHRVESAREAVRRVREPFLVKRAAEALSEARMRCDAEAEARIWADLKASLTEES